MTASYVSQATGTNTATLPTHQAGDFFIALAVRSGTSNPPTVPTANGWVEATTPGGANSLGFALATLTADSNSETTGTFTNATGLTILQYRPASGYRLELGGIQPAFSGSTLTVSTPTLTFIDQGGTSWAISIMGHRSTDLTGVTTPPAGMTNRVAFTGNTMAASDTNGPVLQWQNQSVTYGGTASAYRAFALELRVIPVAPVSRNFYFRTNYRNSTTRFFRTNDINAAGAVLTNTTASGSGVVYQTVIGANIVTDITSAWHNLDFTPVAGDLLALPTRVGNSLITLAADGRFVIQPAVENGTQIQRRARDVSTGIWYQDTLTINNGAGTGFVSVPQVAVSASGVVAGPRVGTGGLFANVPTVSGAGTISSTRGIIRTMVTKLGAPVASGTQVRALVFSSLDPGFTVYHNAVHTIGSGGVLSFTSPNLPAVGSTVILALYDAGASSTGDQDIGMSARRVQIVNVT